MIWQETSSGIHESGFYAIHREVHGYSAWFNHPSNFHLIAKASTLKDAKKACAERVESLLRGLQSKADPLGGSGA